MSKKKKLLKKFLERPAAVTFPEMQILLFSFGFRVDTIRGSHYKFIHPTLKVFIVIPTHHGECKIRYKIRLRNHILTNNLYRL